MMPTPQEQKHIEEKAELRENIKKLEGLIVASVVLSFGSGFVFGFICLRYLS